MIKSFIGSKKFYKMILGIALPIMLQNFITNFVGMLDNIMIGRVGTAEMSGVAIANQLIFVFNLCIFGALSGAGIFGAQFHGNGDTEGVRNSMRYKFLVCALIVIAGTVVFSLFGESLIMTYLKGEGSPENAAASLKYGMEYLGIMIISLAPYALSQIYASTLRETGKTILPMTAGIISVLVNLIFNYILIYGHFGAPALGVRGAAIATLISRFAELAIILTVTHKNSSKYEFIKGIYKKLTIPLDVFKSITIKGMPLLINEALWSIGVAMLNQCYSIHSQDVVAATNITNTLWNVFSVTFMSFGATIGIIIGHRLGAGDVEGAKDDNKKLMAFSFAISVVIGVLYAATSSLFPSIYNTTQSVRELAKNLILIGAIFMPAHSISHSSYFTLRAGGRTFITFLFDSAFILAISYPIAAILSYKTSVGILGVYATIQALDILKCAIGLFLIKKGIWINKIVD